VGITIERDISQAVALPCERIVARQMALHDRRCRVAARVPFRDEYRFPKSASDEGSWPA
jgi:hypothetical protein